jgi:Outer membrane efflux protein
MGIPPSDGRRIVPTSPPAEQRLAPDWNALVHLAEERRPDIVELKIIVEADKERILQAENQALPQLNAVANYQFNGLSGTMNNGDKLSTGAGQFNNWSVGLNFSVPLGLRSERANLRQQKLLITRDTDNVQQSIHAALHQLASTIRDLDNAYDQFLAYKDVRAAAYDNLKVQIGNERVGLINYLNVLQALNDWGNSVSTEAQQLLAYNISLATLERETGTILETHGLVFNEERFRAAGPIPCHDRLYPEAVVPAGTPRFAPGSDQPSEEVFDLKKPDWRGAHPEAPGTKPPPPDPRPLPRPVPLPDKILPTSASTWAAEKQPAPKTKPAPAVLGPPERFPDLLEWPPPARIAAPSNTNP